MTALEGLLSTLPPWVIVGGKGGVGKTTCAAALANGAAQGGEWTLLLSTDPALSLGDAIGETLTATPASVSCCPGLHAMQLDAAHARDAFLNKWRDALVTVLDRGTYLDRDDIAGIVDAAFPGADEAMALLSLLDIDASGEWERIVIDTAPTGHTLRLLELPDTMRALAALLDAMQDKHRFMVRALTHRYREDVVDGFIRELQRQVEAIAERLRDRSRTGVVLVTRDEAVVAAETARYLSALESLAIPVVAIVTNAVAGDEKRQLGAGEHVSTREESTRSRAGDRLVAGFPDADPTTKSRAIGAGAIAPYWVPLLQPPPDGLDGIRRWMDELRAGNAPIAVEGKGWRGKLGRRAYFQRGGGALPPLVRDFTIVGGKGGVGKTTVACALAISAASPERRILLVSTDPAPSVADAIALPVGDENASVEKVPGLFARQMDATAAFARFRERYSTQVDELFDSIVGRGMDAAHDRRIVRDLLALAPPGIDELYALAALGEMLEEELFGTIIVDPAPTGHLLRLLEMPALALDWSHRLLRLMLKYKEVVSLGVAAQDLLSFSHRTRAVAEILADPARTGLLVVSLDEPLVRDETKRLVAEVRARSIPLLGVLWNRAAADFQPLPASIGLPQFAAPVATPPPRGVDAIRQWRGEWFTPSNWVE